jgi:hypothetical protein
MTVSKRRSWAFINPLFWITFGWSLSISVLAKIIVNLFMPPVTPATPGTLRFSELSGMTYPFPPGKLALTHAEHWYSSWPGQTEGILGTIAAELVAWLKNWIQFPNLETWIFITFWALIFFLFSSATIGKKIDRMLFNYLGLGLFLAAFISNQGEIALFSHATDFIFFRFSEASHWFMVCNFADVMAILALVLLIVVSPLYGKRKGRADTSSAAANAK